MSQERVEKFLRDEAVWLLARAPPVKTPADLDLLTFLHRHPRAILTTDQLTEFVGRSAEEITSSIDAFVREELLELTPSADGACLFVLRLDDARWGAVLALAELASTRRGRRRLFEAMGARAPIGVVRVTSGGQTGADQGALVAAKNLGLQTGGWIPKGFRTDAGPDPELAREYGLVETASSSYAPRTRRNVADSDATLWFGDATSPGGVLTHECCRKLGKPVFDLPFPDSLDLFRVAEVRGGLADVRNLNVAGNRERTNPGIFDHVVKTLPVVLAPALRCSNL